MLESIRFQWKLKKVLPAVDLKRIMYLIAAKNNGAMTMLLSAILTVSSSEDEGDNSHLMNDEDTGERESGQNFIEEIADNRER